MAHCRVRLALLLTVFVSSQQTIAQVTYEGCSDFQGVPVASVMNASIPDIALATRAPNGAPVIVYNPNVLSWVSHPTRVFFYAHECAHHFLAHGVVGYSVNQEQEADCWAIQTLVSRRMLDPASFNAIQQDIANFGRGDWSHLPGPIRAINLQYCLGSY